MTPPRAGPAAEIFVVDDDEDIRDLLRLMFSTSGYHVTSFAEGASFLAAARARTPAAILLDVHMPGRSGLDILRELNARRYNAPIFIISGRADIPVAVDAMRRGAFDFIEKPFDADEVVARVGDAIEQWGVRGSDDGDPPIGTFPGHTLLTPRELDVLRQIAYGASNKETARRLAISPRTVEVHRARIMDKLQAKNTAELMRIVLAERQEH